MDRVPEGAVTIGWDGWEGRRALRRNWEQRRDRWLWTGSTWASECRWSMGAIFRDPVAILRAEYWSLDPLEFEHSRGGSVMEPDGSRVGENGAD